MCEGSKRKVKTPRKVLFYAVIIAAIGAAFYVSFKPRPTLADSAEVTRGPLWVSIVEEGKTRVVDRYIVSSPTAGYARRLEFKVGDEVRAGQVLVRLDPLASDVLDPRRRAEATARVTAAEAAVEAARDEVIAGRSDVRYWEIELPRIQDGVEAGVTARREFCLRPRQPSEPRRPA